MEHAPQPLVIGYSQRQMWLCLLGGIAGVAAGLALDFIDQFKGVPLRGWPIYTLAGVFVVIGVSGLLTRKALLVVDAEGVHAPRQRLSIPWGQVAEVRGFTAGGVAPYLLVRVVDAAAVPGFTWNRTKYWAVSGEFAAGEVAISLTGADLSLDAVVKDIRERISARD
jgi:hypothetical protein